MAYQPTSQELRAVNFFLRQQFPNYNFDQLSSDQKLKLASGLVGNLRAESNLNPEAVNPESGAFGISQLLNVRKDNYDKFIEGMFDFDPFQTQLDFLRQELNPGSPYYDSLSGQRFGSIINQMNAGSLQTLPDITKALERAIFRSRPGGYEGEITPEQESIFNSSMAERIKFAQQLASLSPNFYGLKDQPQTSKRRSLSGGLMDMFTQPGREADRTRFLGNLTLALNSMRTTPDQNLALSITEQIKDANEQKAKGAFGSLTKEQIAFAGQIRDDLRVDLKKYVEARTAYNQLLSIFPENTPGGTFAFITAFVKTTDPGSVVRGEEMDAVESSGNIGQKLKNIILANMDMSNRTATLPREIREQMMTVAYKAMQSRTQSAVATYNGALNVAQKQNIPAEYIWFGNPPGDAEEPDFSVLDEVEMEDVKNQDPPEPVVDTRTQTAIRLGVTIQEWNAMKPSDKILFKD